MKSQIPIIFCHYGYSDYLEETLKCAKFTNPGSICYLLGDIKNKEVAEKNGWIHLNYEDFSKGERET